MSGEGKSGRLSLSRRKRIRDVALSQNNVGVDVHVCRHCHFVWLDTKLTLLLRAPRPLWARSIVRNARQGSTFGCDGGALGKPVLLELHREGYRTAEIGHVVIENALVRLARRQRTYGTDRKIFIHPIVRGKRKNFADVIATSLIILAYDESTHSIDEKGTGQNCRVTEICPIIASLR